MPGRSWVSTPARLSAPPSPASEPPTSIELISSDLTGSPDRRAAIGLPPTTRRAKPQPVRLSRYQTPTATTKAMMRPRLSVLPKILGRTALWSSGLLCGCPEPFGSFQGW